MKSIQAILDLKKPHWQYDYNKIHGDIRYRWLLLNYEAVAQLLLSLTLQIVDLPSPGPGFMPMEDIILIAIFSLQGWPRTQDLFIQDWSLFTAILIGANEYAAIQIIYSEEAWYWLDVFGKKHVVKLVNPSTNHFQLYQTWFLQKQEHTDLYLVDMGMGWNVVARKIWIMMDFQIFKMAPNWSTPRQSNMAMENTPFIDMYIDFPIKTFIYVGFAKLPWLITAGM